MDSKDNSVTGRLKALIMRTRTMKLITTEHSIMVQFSLEILVTLAGFYFNISATEWFFKL
jgi:diacylglycerol kinase (ATP)